MPRKLKPKQPGIPPVATASESSLKYKHINPLNREQEELIKVIHRNDLIVCRGLAGSGKTYLSCAVGADYLNRQLVDTLVLSRPQIPAELSGWLPGSLEDKISPFLAPLYTELSYFLNVKKEINDGRLVIMPIAYCRGVTFKNAFVIVDEFENMDFRQLKMILTRLGQNSKMVLCGDTSQSDMDSRNRNDCCFVVDRLRKLAEDPENRIAIFELTKSVRHPLIEKILLALEGY